MRKGVLRNFTKFTGKHLCQSLFFNKAEAYNFIKTKVFSCEFAKFLRTHSENVNPGILVNARMTKILRMLVMSTASLVLVKNNDFELYIKQT